MDLFRFGKTSSARLKDAHPDLRKICHRALRSYDLTILETHRTDAKQKEYYDKGLSKLDGITHKSKHQTMPSMAVDIAPYPIDWNNTDRFYYLAGLMMGAAKELFEAGEITHKLRWGRDWDRDTDFDDNRFNDYPHFELIKAE